MISNNPKKSFSRPAQPAQPAQVWRSEHTQLISLKNKLPRELLLQALRDAQGHLWVRVNQVSTADWTQLTGNVQGSTLDKVMHVKICLWW